jgi:hypothetical protein
MSPDYQQLSFGLLTWENADNGKPVQAGFGAYSA